MNYKYPFLKIFDELYSFFLLFRNFLKKTLILLNPYYDYGDRQEHTITNVEFYYRKIAQWVISILFNAFFFWLALLLFESHRLSLQSIGLFLTVWLVGGLAKSVYDYYVEGRVRWTKEYPRAWK